MDSIKIDPLGPDVKVRIRILKQHLGTWRADVWSDTNGDGVPRDLVRTLKDLTGRKDVYAHAGTPAELIGRYVQLVAIPSRPQGGDSEWRVLLEVKQGNRWVADFPREVTGDYGTGNVVHVSNNMLKVVQA